MVRLKAVIKKARRNIIFCKGNQMNELTNTYLVNLGKIEFLIGAYLNNSMGLSSDANDTFLAWVRRQANTLVIKRLVFQCVKELLICGGSLSFDDTPSVFYGFNYDENTEG
jgi:hypothetical protein